MASEHTQNYNLSRWILADEVRMEDFNSDNEKIDAALSALSSGQLRAACGTYTGTGSYGSATPNALTFDFEPRFMLIMGNYFFCLFIQGFTEAYGGSVNTLSQKITEKVVWGGNTVSWYAYMANSDNAGLSLYSAFQLNSANQTYHYFAVG